MLQEPESVKKVPIRQFLWTLRISYSSRFLIPVIFRLNRLGFVKWDLIALWFLMYYILSAQLYLSRTNTLILPLKVLPPLSTMPICFITISLIHEHYLWTFIWLFKPRSDKWYVIGWDLCVWNQRYWFGVLKWVSVVRCRYIQLTILK